MKSINNQLPKVTICVPVRNGARTIQRTLDSLLSQDYPNYEIIVSDNCSDDDTAKIVSQYASNGVKYFFNPTLEKCGESNWNHILTLAEGPFIALYHADDICTPTMVRRQVEFMETHLQVSAVFTMMQRIDENDRPLHIGSTHLPKELQGQDCFDFGTFFNAVLKYGTFTPVPTMMTRRQVIDAVGVFQWEKFASASDIDLYLRMVKQWGPIGIIDEPLHRYRLSHQQGSNLINMSRTHAAHFIWVLEHYITIPEFRSVAKPDALLGYDMQKISDIIFRATNLTVLKQPQEAYTLIYSVSKKRAFIKGIFNSKYSRQFLMALVLLVAIRCGFGGSIAFMYTKIYRPYRFSRTMKVLESKAQGG
jgi:glycosyltransferase involved in cell wall biosynthesis